MTTFHAIKVVVYNKYLSTQIVDSRQKVRAFLFLDPPGDSAIMKIRICKRMEVESMAQGAIREYDSQLPLLARR